MKTGLLILACLCAASCAFVATDKSAISQKPLKDDHIIFANATVNGQPVRIALDTGSSVINMWSSTAQRLDLKTKIPEAQSTFTADGKPAALTEPIYLSLNGQKIETPFGLLSWHNGEAGYDGVVGWEQIKDNIFVFNPDNRTVATVEKLPDVSGWLKLKIHHGTILTLELPMSDGRPGEIIVDTGSVEGVQLSPLQWSAFVKQHPNIATDSTKYQTSEGVRDLPHTVADKISIGSLDLTNVDINEASDYEAEGVDDYYCTFGMKAFSRMELILDGRDGYAYTRPRPASAARAELKEWTFTGNLNLRADDMFGYIARAQIALGDYDGATVEVSHMLELYPRSPIALALRGYLKLKRGEPNAMDDIQAALAEDPHNTTALDYSAAFKYEQKDFAGAIADYDSLLEQEPADSNGYFNRALANVNLGKNEDAVVDFDRTLNLNPGFADALILRARLCDIKNDYDGAISDYTHYLKLKPDNSTAYTERANSYFRKGDYTNAAADYSHSLALDPKDASTWYWRGRSYELMGATAKAQADYTKASELDPKYAPR